MGGHAVDGLSGRRERAFYRPARRARPASPDPPRRKITGVSDAITRGSGSSGPACRVAVSRETRYATFNGRARARLRLTRDHGTRHGWLSPCPEYR